ncbi:KH domain-containing protein [Paenibacillus apiarius]|uniref:RNA-binding protein KhpA n=1 Tax=Paenibacillus apiarius TaxID=46240 RepID=A0ABT4DLV7_9BACL|nr:KH domain-containing protein [Paenibacillus apiarius]MBN3526162.1 KH domain-containing protein [Paenibacillus apiarius]MCY9517737.1 KH domain-containing protein [Paenibacillus apiarius]MCY9518337.1 KH domain-containing protein [Paenibacillus apiarius]MCY9551262.1 KH domain-containing protein [Paenibacillus apiarius]MCY9558416.1 KH domain-containing protein [Paenibacillus apiarius]
MEELVLVIARALVDHPEEVRVDVVEKDHIIVYELYVHPEDVGKVIGKQGRIAKALRTVVTSAAVKVPKRVAVDIIS